jgi:hypothetical protein
VGVVRIGVLGVPCIVVTSIDSLYLVVDRPPSSAAPVFAILSGLTATTALAHALLPGRQDRGRNLYRG